MSDTAAASRRLPTRTPKGSLLRPFVALCGWMLCCAALATPSVATADDAPAATGNESGEVAGGREKRSRLSDELARQGETELRKSVRVFQQRYLIKSGRVELLAGGATSIGDPLIHHFNVDAGLMYHLNDNWAVGVSGSKPFGSETENFNSIQNFFGLFPERSLIQGMGFAEVQYSPIFGKFSSFGIAVVQMDAYLLAGVGGARTTVGDAIKPAGHVGLGLRIHTLRALTVSFEIRDVMMMETFQAGDRFLQHIFGGIKLGFWIPPTVQYRYQR
jgi:outer membrane beta-barrel protein